MRRFQSIIRGYYAAHARVFPWRGTRDPYHILVSEIMLQQTRTESVAKLYPVFLERYPTVRSLASSTTPALLQAWLGLGYNRRALALRECARRIVSDHGGTVPARPEELAALPGIGPATSASIAAFAYDAPVTFIETNIRRVYLYFFFPRRTVVRDDEILPLVERTLDRSQPGRWYSALMDYGVMMKKALPGTGATDPNRRSAHYTRQAPFEGSDRQVRGRVLKVLTSEGPLTPAVLLRRLASAGEVRDSERRLEPERLERILGALENDGFVARSGKSVRIA